jgi:anti-sigma B factor antagonist
MITETSTRTVEPDVRVVTISGRLSLGNSLMSVESSIKRMIADGSRKVVIDLSGLDSIDSAGIGTLISCNGEMERSGGHFRVAGAHGMVARSFETIHMSRVVPLDPDVESACRNLA